MVSTLHACSLYPLLCCNFAVLPISYDLRRQSLSARPSSSLAASFFLRVGAVHHVAEVGHGLLRVPRRVLVALLDSVHPSALHVEQPLGLVCEASIFFSMLRHLHPHHDGGVGCSSLLSSGSSSASMPVW